MRRIVRPSAWKFALLAGFVTQLLLLIFVTAIGLQQLEVATDKLNQVVDVHMRKQTLTKTMMVSARERTIFILMLSKTPDSVERDNLLIQFSKNGSAFGMARQELRGLPLSIREQELLALQGQLTNASQPLQLQVIDLINADFIEAAEDLIRTQAIPKQNQVIAALSQLDAEAQKVALEASSRARDDHEMARKWLFLLSGTALLIGFLVAAFVFLYASRAGRARERLSTEDTLTGLPNRMLFMDRLEQSLIRAERHATLVGVMFIDLDRFKRVNDTLGHASGDQLICEVAQRLRAATRAEDIVARLGGDEFVVVVGDIAEIKHILQVVEKMLAAVAAPYQIAERELFCSCSIGISVYPHDGDDSGDLLKYADTAMYHAKSSGRNRFQLYDPAMNAMAEERLQLETDLHYALGRNEFILHYQPQVDLDTGRTHAVEALVRWNHPNKGLLSPAVFLEMLEETGQIVSVGRQLLETACHQTVRWHAAGFSHLEVAVNLSSKEFWHEGLIASVQTALAQSGLPPHALQLELTEGIFMESMDAAVKRVHELKALGITVSVDDFGTGYSSLAHLKRFPLDVLKIDRYFVKDVQHDPVNEALIRSILSLSQDLKLKNVAEGIETQAQLECLRKLGCQIVQGYFISQPVPAAQLATLLSRDWLPAFNLAHQVQPKRQSSNAHRHTRASDLSESAESTEVHSATQEQDACPMKPKLLPT
ncbi:MAG: EAL domain-containing protein [Thiobacillus sp.]|nr:EAL domain-containing protein [Thiobacillus sp.]